MQKSIDKQSISCYNTVVNIKLLIFTKSKQELHKGESHYEKF